MPLPKPHKKTEKESEFISRCMSNEHIQNDFKTQKIRLGVCYSLWRTKKSKADYVITTGEDLWTYTITPDDEEKNPLDHESEKPDDSTSPTVPDKTPDKWPAEAPKALDDTDTKALMNPLDQSNTPYKENPLFLGSDFVKKSDYKNKDQGNPPKDFPSLSGPGIDPNPDNGLNFPIKPDGEWKHPALKDMKWLPAQDYTDDVSDDYTDDVSFLNYLDKMPDKMKEWYIGQIDEMPEYQEDAKWPLSFDKIEKDFHRPKKDNTPENNLRTKQSEDYQDPNKVEKRDKPFAI